MNILLLNPPFRKPVIREGRCQTELATRNCSIPQMSLSYMATQLERAGHRCQIIDSIAIDADEKLIKMAIQYNKYELVFVNTSTPTIESDLSVCEMIRLQTGAKVAVFGCHVTALADEIMATGKVDCIISGEPELSAVEIAKELSSHGKLSQWNYECPPVDNLDMLGFPARHLLPNNLYIHPVYGKPFATINIARGCPHGCIFCTASQYYGKGVRVRSCESIIREIEHCIERYGIKHFWMYAEDGLCKNSPVHDAYFVLRAKELGITWWCNSRADNIDVPTAARLKKSGCVLVSIGAESGDRHTLDIIGKRSSPETTKRAVRCLREAGVESLPYFIIGWPWDWKGTIDTTIDFACELDSDYCEFYTPTPFPGTDLYRLYRDDIEILDWSRFYCGGTEDIYGTAQGDIKRAYRRFYLRPKYIARKLFSRNLWRLAKFGIRRLLWSI